jgi:hypothetical protein
MLYFQPSSKLSNSWEQYLFYYEDTVLFRVAGAEGQYTLMTATAGEDNQPLRAYPEQERLLIAAHAVFDALPEYSKFSLDQSQRLFLECRGLSTLQQVSKIALEAFEMMHTETMSQALATYHQMVQGPAASP